MKRITFISDTHNQHKGLDIEPCDILIHAGDFSGRGWVNEFRSFITWFENQPAEHKVFIAGNHDFCFENEYRHVCHEELKAIKGVTYLQDSMVEIDGLKIYGSPWTPYFYNWAFNAHRKIEHATKLNPWIKNYWDMIPEGVDILITHGPPNRILDQVDSHGPNAYEYVGCELLMDKIRKIKPKVHVFGHIHEQYGIEEQDGTTFINASVLNSQYQLVNKPITLEI